jgi:hypothetical protein
MPADGDSLQLWRRAKAHSGKAATRRFLAVPLLLAAAVLLAVAAASTRGLTPSSPVAIAGAVVAGLGVMLLGSYAVQGAKAKALRETVKRQVGYAEELDLLDLRVAAAELRETAPGLIKLKAEFARAVAEFRNGDAASEQDVEQPPDVAEPEVKRLAAELESIEKDWITGGEGQPSGADRIREFTAKFQEKTSELQGLVEKIIS